MDITAKQPINGPGCFQWNAGGWFGGQIGSTLWMLVGGVPLAIYSATIGITWLTCFAVANAAGTCLWMSRDRLRPYPAYQLLLLIIAVSGLVALFTFDVLRPDSRSNNGLSFLGIMGRGDLQRGYCFLLVIVPLGMVWAHFMERSAKAKCVRP
jgi:hypothetical protein